MIVPYLANAIWVNDAISTGVTVVSYPHHLQKIPIWAVASVYTNSAGKLWNCLEFKNLPGSLHLQTLKKYEPREM